MRKQKPDRGVSHALLHPSDNLPEHIPEKIVIVGAGPAGCVAAIMLGREGFDVTLVEQHRFPRDKVCGECLSTLGLSVLESLGLREKLRSRCNPVPLLRTVCITADGSRLELKLPAAMWGISRTALDSALLSLAAGSCRILQPARAERLSHGDNLVFLSVRDLASNSITVIRADWVLIADGKGALGNSKPVPTRDLGVKSHWRGLDAPRDAIELFGVDGHYGGIAPVDDQQFNISFSVPAIKVQAFAGDLDGLFRSFARQNRELHRQLGGATRCSVWLAAPLPRFGVADHWPRGVIPLGNAAAALEPIGGEGMGLAMQSAVTVATELISARNSSRAVNLPGMRNQFRRVWTPRRAACRLAAAVFSRPALASPAIELFNCAPSLGAGLMRLVGK